MSIFNSFLYVSPRRCISSPRAPGTAMKNRIIPGPGNGQAMLLQARLVPPHLAILRCAMQGAIERKTQKNTDYSISRYLQYFPVRSVRFPISSGSTTGNIIKSTISSGSNKWYARPGKLT